MIIYETVKYIIYFPFKVKTAKDFWVQLPYQMCNNYIDDIEEDDKNCWNGRDRAK